MFILNSYQTEPPLHLFLYKFTHQHAVSCRKTVIDKQGSINAIKTNQSVNHFPFKKNRIICFLPFFLFTVHYTVDCARKKFKKDSFKIINFETCHIQVISKILKKPYRRIIWWQTCQFWFLFLKWFL